MRRRAFLKSGMVFTGLIWVPKGISQNLNPGRALYTAGLLKPASGAAFSYTATQFDSGDYMVHSGDLASIADSKLCTGSIWFKLNASGENGTLRYLWCMAGDLNMLAIDTDNTLMLITQTSGGSAYVARYRTSATFTQSASWRHVAWSFNAADSGQRHFYVDGSADGGSWSVYADLTVDWTPGNDFGWSARFNGINIVSASYCEPYLKVGEYVDLSSSLTTFRTAGGKPAGSLTSRSPSIYFPNAFGTFGTNAGTGGNFTVTGTLSNDASIP